MKRVAIIIGHRSKSKGAFSQILGKQEYDFNKDVATYLTDIADIYERPNTRFVSEAYRIKQLVNEVNKHNYDLVISLHFNSFHNPKAHGATALYYITNAYGKQLAHEYVQMVSDDFGIKKRNLIPIQYASQRGGTLIAKLKSTAVLLEPFFGSNKADAKQFKNKECEYAQLIRNLILKYQYQR